MGIASIDTDLAIHHVLAALVADQQEALRRGGYHATAYAMLEDAGVLAAAGARSTVPPSTSASGERTAAADLLLRAAWCLYRYAALVAAEVAARAHPAGPADHAAGAADLLAGAAAALPADSPVRRLCAALRPLLGRLEGYLDEQLTTTDAASTALPVGAAGAEDDIRWLQQLADLLGELDTTADHTFPLGR